MITFDEFYSKNKHLLRKYCTRLLKDSYTNSTKIYTPEDLEHAVVEYLLKYPSLWRRTGAGVSDSSTIYNAVKRVYVDEMRHENSCGTVRKHSRTTDTMHKLPEESIVEETANLWGSKE